MTFAALLPKTDAEMEELERACAKRAAERKAAGLPPLPTFDPVAYTRAQERAALVRNAAPRPALRRTFAWHGDVHTLH